jgi:hypothetical protein
MMDLQGKLRAITFITLLGLFLRKLLGYEKELLLATTQRKQQQKLLETTISLHWWASVYQLLDRVNFFFHQYSLFISILLSPACFGLLVPQQHFLFWDILTKP